MTYTKKQFIEDVKKEAMALRKHATKEELDRLDFYTLDPQSPTRCTYGQLSGDCDNDRASELIKACAPVLFAAHDFYAQYPLPIEKFLTYRWSPIEIYINRDYAKNKNLIDYLKGNRNDLVL